MNQNLYLKWCNSDLNELFDYVRTNKNPLEGILALQTRYLNYRAEGKKEVQRIAFFVNTLDWAGMTDDSIGSYLALSNMIRVLPSINLRRKQAKRREEVLALFQDELFRRLITYSVEYKGSLTKKTFRGKFQNPLIVREVQKLLDTGYLVSSTLKGADRYYPTAKAKLLASDWEAFGMYSDAYNHKKGNF